MPPASARVFPAGDVLPPVRGGNSPLELYKYVSVKNTLYTIKTGDVYFSNVRDFNDPFDGKPIVRLDSPKDEKEVITHVRLFMQKMENMAKTLGVSNEKILALFNPENILSLPRASNIFNEVFSRMNEKQNIGVFCMSENPDSFPMWAHYADGHTGCCLKFDLSVRLGKCDWRKCFPFVWLGKVEYGEQSPKFPDTKLILPHARGSAYMSKSLAWKYEGEWRAVVYDSSAKSPSTGNLITDGMHPAIVRKMKGSGEYPLQKDLLTGVILGHKMKESDIKSVTAAAKRARLEIYEAEPEQSDYGMSIKRIYAPPAKSKQRGKGG